VIVITGGAGFIGSNLARRLCHDGSRDAWIVDDLADARKFRNLVGLPIAEYTDRDAFLELLNHGDAALDSVEAIVHQGACTSTTESDGRHVLRYNYEYTREIIDFCVVRSIPLVYASSAAVYGASSACRESPEFERPLNVYGFSKLLIDNYVRRLHRTRSAPVIGLRYFNVYGPGEAHKGAMSSIVLQLHDQIARTGVAALFGASHGVGNGEQRRDFVHVDDVVSVVTWALEHPNVTGIYNVGTGQAWSYNEVAEAVIQAAGAGRIAYLPFPRDLAEAYQSFTQADIARLRAAGYEGRFRRVDEGVTQYVGWLRSPDGRLEDGGPRA
jgi:ADP-L-glycero-D-manno-heptose 6-epimerase